MQEIKIVISKVMKLLMQHIELIHQKKFIRLVSSMKTEKYIYCFGTIPGARLITCSPNSPKIYHFEFLFKT